MSTSDSALEKSPLFHNLTGEELLAIRRLARPKSLPPYITFICEQEPVNTVYVVLQGTVKVFVSGQDGREVIIALRGPGDVVGEIGLSADCCQCASAVTQEPTELLCFERAQFGQMLQQTPTLSLNLIQILSHRLSLATAHIQSLAASDVHGRVAYQLLALCREYGRRNQDGALTLDLRLTQKDMADLVGASRVRVNQVYATWKRLKIIDVDAHNRITLLDKNALEKCCR